MTFREKDLVRILDRYEKASFIKTKRVSAFFDIENPAPNIDFKPFFSPLIRREFGAVMVSEEMRSPKLDLQMEEKSVQFFLRNIPRLTKEPPDWLEFDVRKIRDSEGENITQELRKMRYRPPEMIERWNMETMISHRVLIKKLFHTMKWTTFFSREIKEKLECPIWKQKVE